MKRCRQTLEEILSALSNIETSWKDGHSQSVIEMLESMPVKMQYGLSDVAALLEKDFSTALTVVRLFLDLSKDEFTGAMRQLGKGLGVVQYRKDPQSFLAALSELRLCEMMTSTAQRPLAWYDTLVERLKAGRGSAIKGQVRGRFMEDFVDNILKDIFNKYDVRCRFTGATTLSTEKADFAIPSKEDPSILIEVKAYGATGSKQTDILGDIGRIGEQKRDDTALLLVTDGATWKARTNDLRKLVALQNQGRITRIYTFSMADELREDLLQLKKEHCL